LELVEVWADGAVRPRGRERVTARAARREDRLPVRALRRAAACRRGERGLRPGDRSDVCGHVVDLASLDEVRRHVHALVALSRVLDLVGHDLLDGALLEVRAPPGTAHGREGLVEVRPHLATRTGRAEGVTACALGREERLAALRASAFGDAAG